MAADFPNSLHDFSATYANDTAQEDTHPGIHNDVNEELAATQEKVGIDGSADTDSLEYDLRNAASSNPGHRHTLANGATDVTASAAELNITDGGQTTEKVLNVQSKASAYLSADQENLVDVTATKVTLNTETFDIGSDFDTANNKFVAPVTGYYAVHAAVQFKSVVADKPYLALIYVNGSAVREARVHSTSTAQVSANVSGLVYATAAQDIELYAQQNSGVNTVDIDSTASRTFMDVYLHSI